MIREKRNCGELTRLTDLLIPGDLIVIAGRPGMGKTDLACDLICSGALPGMPVYISLELSADAITERLARRKRRPCIIFDRADRSVEDIMATLSDLDVPVSVIALDYLQLTAPDEPNTLLKKLKELAFALHVPVIVLSQLPRSVDARADKRPRLDDLPVQTEAVDTAILLFSDDYYALREMHGVEAIVAKSLAGLYTVPLRWRRAER